MSKVKSAIYLREAQLFLDECKRTHEPVWIVALKMNGELLRLDGWQVISGYWQAGTHDYRHPMSGQIRKLKDLLLFEINGHPVYV